MSFTPFEKDIVNFDECLTYFKGPHFTSLLKPRNLEIDYWTHYIPLKPSLTVNGVLDDFDISRFKG